MTNTAKYVGIDAETVRLMQVVMESFIEIHEKKQAEKECDLSPNR